MNNPLIPNGKTKFIKSIDVQSIVDKYKSTLNIDVSNFFQTIDKIEIYECIKTGYRYYYPPIIGDEDFYIKLSKLDWYYEKWKWEYEIALTYIKPNMDVLEIGCGMGSFVEKVQNQGINILGIEINQEAVSYAKAHNINVINSTLDELAARFPDKKYNLICSFQVMEHVPNIREILDLSVHLLKENGILLISVPNNNSLLRYDFNILNYPPHHVGLWSDISLKKLSKILNMKLINIHKEPVNWQSFDSDRKSLYFKDILKKIINNLFGQYGKHIYSITIQVMPLLKIILPSISNGFTVVGVYKKHN